MRRFLFIVILLVMTAIASMAQVDRRASESVRVYFKQGYATLDENYKGNRETLRRFADAVNALQRDTSCKVNKVRIVASVSPEGNNAINKRLVNKRAEAIVSWLNKNIDKPLGYTVDLIDTDWETLIKLVEENPNVPYKAEVLDVLHNTPVHANGENMRYKQLTKLRKGVPYGWLLKNLFPELRYSNAQLDVWWNIIPELFITSAEEMNFAYEGGNGVISFSKNVNDNVAPSVTCAADWIHSIVVNDNTIDFKVAPNPAHEARSTVIIVSSYGKTHKVTVNQQPAPVIEEEPVVPPAPIIEEKPIVIPEPECKPFYMAAKTNMLYLLAATPNIGLEFYLGKRWSIAANWQYAWWKSDHKEWYWRNYGGDLAIRKWFGKQSKEAPLSGHHLGLYGQIITYDYLLPFSDKGILADRWSWAAGLEYGYSLPVARRFNIDFTFGVGYHWGEFKEYTPIDGHYVWQANKQRHYIGPTKLEVSLVWLLGCDNYNKNKGGKR